MKNDGGIRAINASEMRESGMLLREIAAHYSISKERARQLVMKGDRLRSVDPDTTRVLSVRTQNALVNGRVLSGDECHKGVGRDELKARLPKNLRDLMRIRNFGRKSYRELCAWLHVDPWTGETL